MSIQSLESERQAILHRMHMSRSSYRHLLMDDSAADHDKPATHFADQPPYSGAYSAPSVTQGSGRSVVLREDRFPRSATMRVITRHPVACSVALAALLVIGPRRMLRMARSGSSRVTEVTRRNRDNFGMLARVAKLALPYVPAATQYLRPPLAARRRL